MEIESETIRLFSLYSSLRAASLLGRRMEIFVSHAQKPENEHLASSGTKHIVLIITLWTSFWILR